MEVIKKDKSIALLFLRSIFSFYRRFISASLAPNEDYFFRIVVIFVDLVIIVFKFGKIFEMSLKIPAIAKLFQRCGFQVTVQMPLSRVSYPLPLRDAENTMMPLDGTPIAVAYAAAAA